MRHAEVKWVNCLIGRNYLELITKTKLKKYKKWQLKGHGEGPRLI